MALSNTFLRVVNNFASIPSSSYVYHNVESQAVGIKINLESDLLESPVAMTPTAYNIYRSHKYQEFFTWFVIKNYFVEAKSIDSALRHFSDTHSNELQKVVFGNNDYFGSHGIILDNNFKPLLVLTNKFDEKRNSFYRPSRYRRFNEIPVESSLYVNPKVFISDNSLEKGIIKKIIPYYISNYGPIIVGEKKFDIKITEDIPFIVSPKSPKDLNVTEEANATLRNNLMYILEQVTQND